jgi:glycosyltransferase involved in cell wall biosynthesis
MLKNISPLVTIITVTKNCASTIENTLISIQAVKTPAVEYIVVDGLSDDGTLDILNRYDSMIDKLIVESDTGIYNAMNKGGSLASGRFVLFINGDDELIPDGFVQAQRVLEKTDADVVCFGSVVLSMAGAREHFFAQPSRLVFYNSVPHPSTLVSTEIMQAFRFREDLRIASDYDLFLRLKLAGKQFKVYKILMAMHYRGGASGDILKSSAEVERVKRENLGWRYFPISMIQKIHRFRKSIMNPSNSGASIT